MSARGGDRPWTGRRLHFVGVGGAGMSGYARAAHALGAQVSGSDRALSGYARGLQDDGILSVAVGHAAENVPPQGEVEVVYSSAVAPENAERAAARARGLAELPRAALLGELSALRRTIAVAGAHGKTTTSAMLVQALQGAGEDPGFLIGGTFGAGDRNAHWSLAPWLVVEADESDRSMLALHTEIAVVTNVELDHHATYGSEAEVREVFRSFLAGAPQAVIWDRPDLLALREGPTEVFDTPDLVLGRGGSRFRWRGREVSLNVPGAHNALNAAAALEAARLAGADPDAAVAALAAFTGAGRRFAHLGRTSRGAEVYDDYAHHPTEVAATLRGARSLEPERLVAVFQPHLYSRTRRLAGDFGRALALADVVAVTEVYPAREASEDFPGVDGALVARAAADASRGRQVLWLPGFPDAARVLGGLVGEGDVVVVMGAGDVDGLGRQLVGA